MATGALTGVLQQVNGENVYDIYPKTTAAQVAMESGKTVEENLATAQDDIAAMKPGVVNVVESIPNNAPDGLYFVVDDNGQ